MERESNNNNNYISLQKAAELCNYSQEYLSLRARQGKLKSVKIGRNWVTTKEWLEDYLKKAEDYNNKYNNKHLHSELPEEPKRIVPSARAKLGAGLVPHRNEVSGAGQSPESLPLPSSVEHTRVSRPNGIESERMFLSSKTKTALFVMGGIILILFGAVFAPYRFKKTGEDSQLAAVSSQYVFWYTIDTFKEYGVWLDQTLKGAPQDVARSYFAANDFVEKKINQGWKQFSQLWTKKEIAEQETEFKKIEKEKVSTLEKDIIGDVQERFKEFRQELKITEKEKEGAIVALVEEGKEEETKKRVKKLSEVFSDEVKIEPDETGTSGIIKPIFKTLLDQKYLYMMVPVKN